MASGSDVVQRVHLEDGGRSAAEALAGAKDVFGDDPGIQVFLEAQQTAVRYTGTAVGNTPWAGEAEGQLMFSNPVFDVWNKKATVDQAVSVFAQVLRTLAGQ